MRKGAVILCGGRSSRMGVDKSVLPFGAGETLLQRVSRIIAKVVPSESIVCVTAAGPLPRSLPTYARFLRDRVAGGGPLEAVSVGLAALAGAADGVFVAGCDMPLLTPLFIERMFGLLGADRIAAAQDGERWHPLPAVYRPDVCHEADALLAAGEQRLAALLEVCRARRISVEDLRAVDPHLGALWSCNTPDEYQAALRAAGVGDLR